MCTCFTYPKRDFLFGRNMDIECNLGQKVVISPRHFRWKWRKEKSNLRNYAIIGMASIVDDFPLYADAVNEHGLCMAGLNFPKNAHYNEYIEGKINITPFEIIPYILSKYKTVEEAMLNIEDLNLYNENFSENLPLTPLHYMLADKDNCIIIEPEEDGIHIYNSDVGVMTNNPQYPFHRVNLENYMHLRADNFNESFIDLISPDSYGRGMGSFGLPGDSSPMSRFVRTVFNKYVSNALDESIDPVVEVFRILDMSSMIRVGVQVGENMYEKTAYSCCINASMGIYYFRTYENMQVYSIDMNREQLNTNILLEFTLPLGNGVLNMN